MFLEIKDHRIWCGYKKVAITEFERVQNMQLLYGDREYRLTLADGRTVKVILNQDRWEKLEGNSIYTAVL